MPQTVAADFPWGDVWGQDAAVETLRSAADVGGWHKAYRMGVAVGVVCHLEEGRFEIFPESRVRDLIEALRGASLVIGYNIKRFDYLVLSGYTGEDFSRLLPTLDLLEDVASRLGFRVGMGHLAQETLGIGLGKRNIFNCHDPA